MKLSELRLEVATQVIAQFPELANLIKASMSEYRGMLDNIIKSNDESINQGYGIYNKAIGSDNDSRKEYIEFADRVRSDLSKCLDNPNLTLEEQKNIREQEMEILRMVDKKDTEIREEKMKTVEMADQKDTEKREFNWKLISAASFVTLTAVSVGVAALGGKIDLKLPKPKL